MDIKTERRHYLNVPMVARYLRLHPLTWRKRIGLRAGAIGCHHTGEDCGPGFLRVNTKAGCGERIYNEDIFIVKLRLRLRLRLLLRLTQAHSGSYSVTVTVTQSLG